MRGKSRLVARRFQPREGIVWSSYVPLTFSAIACDFNLVLCHFDVDQAFLQSKLDADVFLRCLPKECGSLSGEIVRLNKSMCGLKQVFSRSWHAHLNSYLKHYNRLCAVFA